MGGIAEVFTALGAVAGLLNKPKQAQIDAPAAPAKPPQESKAPERQAISADQKAAATLFGSGPERAPISTADLTLGKSALKGNAKLGE